MPNFGESLLEFITRVEQGYGLGSQMPPVFDLIKGTGLTSGGNQLVYTDFFTQTYGRKVWDVLNNQVKFFNVIRKVPFGTTVGWRNRSARNASTSPVLENTNLPAVNKQTYQQIWSPPRAIVTMLGVTEQAQFLSGLEGGIGDSLAVEQEFAATDHIKDINRQMLARNYVTVKTAGNADGSTAVFHPLGDLCPLRVGDCIENPKGNTISIVGAISAADGKHTIYDIGTTTPDDFDQDDTCVIHGRGGITSIDDIVEIDDRSFPGVDPDDARCYSWGVIPGSTSDSDTSRDSGTYNAGYVCDNDGVPRYLETELLDEAIRQVRIYGGEPDLILGGFDQLDRIDQLLQAMRRYMPTADFQVKRGGEATLPGFQGGFQLATYRGIPYFPDVDAPQSQLYATTAGLTAQGSDVFVLDTRWLEMAVASMTRYFESRDYLQNDMLGIKAMFFTYMELRCLDVRKQAKITDLKTV